MQTVKFPEINLSLTFSEIAIQIGTLKIYWYAIFITSAIVIALVGMIIDRKIYNIEKQKIIEMILIVVPISFLSARLYYILFNLDYYLKNINQILDIRNGGLAIYGGIFGAIIAIGIFCRKRNIDFLDMLDMVVPYLALGQSIGRWGNFFNIEAYGVQTQNIFRMGIIENGRYIEVHPTFLYESICTFILFLILTYVKKHRQYKGQLTYIYLLIYSIIRAIIEGMRIDSLMLGDFRISQIVSIIIFIIAFVLLILKRNTIDNKVSYYKIWKG